MQHLRESVTLFEESVSFEMNAQELLCSWLSLDNEGMEEGQRKLLFFALPFSQEPDYPKGPTCKKDSAQKSLKKLKKSKGRYRRLCNVERQEGAVLEQDHDAGKVRIETLSKSISELETKMESLKRGMDFNKKVMRMQKKCLAAEQVLFLFIFILCPLLTFCIYMCPARRSLWRKKGVHVEQQSA